MGGSIMPSGITAAFGASTAAMQAKMSGAKGGRKSAKKRRRKSARVKATTTKRRRRRVKTAGKRLTKGSAAAKAWGRKMKRLRKRK